jgi:hypothetical protein
MTAARHAAMYQAAGRTCSTQITHSGVAATASLPAQITDQNDRICAVGLLRLGTSVESRIGG